MHGSVTFRPGLAHVRACSSSVRLDVGTGVARLLSALLEAARGRGVPRGCCGGVSEEGRGRVSVLHEEERDE